jgi:hypothetical protein
MDINLPDMLGSEATKIMRSYEKEYSFKKSIIIAVSVEGKNNVGENDLFNDYCKLVLVFFIVFYFNIFIQ